MDDHLGATKEDFERNFPTNEAKRKRLDEVARSMGLPPLDWSEVTGLAEGLGIIEPEREAQRPEEP